MFSKQLVALAGAGLILLIAGLGMAAIPAVPSANPVAVIQTSAGEITVELFKDKAPKTVANFLSYVKAGFYRGTIFHRVMKGFMIQGGGLTAAMSKKLTKEPIQNEAGNGLLNDRGTIAMARLTEVNSATAQFFINTKDNASLNHSGESSDKFGYAVFGKVIAGMDVVDKIESAATATKGSYQNVPVQTIVIKNILLKP
jgi:cyclophilin family peptidyl-prolyl cis-trans isomerase